MSKKAHFFAKLAVFGQKTANPGPHVMKIGSKNGFFGVFDAKPGGSPGKPEKGFPPARG